MKPPVGSRREKSSTWRIFGVVQWRKSHVIDFDPQRKTKTRFTMFNGSEDGKQPTTNRAQVGRLSLVLSPKGDPIVNRCMVLAE
jgi:hypothetical protein